MNIIKQVVGIDISKDSLSVCYGTLTEEQNIKTTNPISFNNTNKGFKELIYWAKKSKRSNDHPLYFVMEATGVYYENLAYFLKEKHQKVIVVLPNKTKNYSKTLDIKSKTDKIDACMLAQFGLERQLRLWEVPSGLLKILKELTREHQSIKALAVQVKNQLHAKEHSYQPSKQTIKRLNQQLSLFDKQINQIEKQIKELIGEDPDIDDRIKKIIRIEGVGLMTAVSVIAETNGFALIENTRQLASYAGLDVVHNQSGLKKHKTSISKKGNRFLRKSLYMPALAACRYNPKLNQVYIRLVKSKNNKKIAIIAVARKLLILIYTIWKKNVDYIPNYNPTLT